MKLITCTGYTCSGSSAVNNILMEFDNCCRLTPKNECRFLQDPDGISDLEYYLFDNRHRLNSEFAIKRYKRYIYKYDLRNFKQIFGDNWKKYNDIYIKKLIKFEYSGYWHADIRNFNIFQKIKYYYFRVNKIIYSKITKTSSESTKNYFPKMKMSLPIDSRNDFYKATRELCEDLFNSLNDKNYDFGIVDQLIPPRNIERYTNYLNDIKVIVVDRDPRDIYIECVHKNDRAFPTDVEKFCEIFIDNRKGTIVGSKNVLEIYFEDLVYKYEDTKKEILNFIGEKNLHHVNEGKIYSIEKSKNNTKLWEKYPEYGKEIEYIEKKLKNYLYNYE